MDTRREGQIITRIQEVGVILIYIYIFMHMMYIYIYIFIDIHHLLQFEFWKPNMKPFPEAFRLLKFQLPLLGRFTTHNCWAPYVKSVLKVNTRLASFNESFPMMFFLYLAGQLIYTAFCLFFGGWGGVETGKLAIIFVNLFFFCFHDFRGGAVGFSRTKDF